MGNLQTRCPNLQIGVFLLKTLSRHSTPLTAMMVVKCFSLSFAHGQSSKSWILGRRRKKQRAANYFFSCGIRNDACLHAIRSILVAILFFCHRMILKLPANLKCQCFIPLQYGLVRRPVWSLACETEIVG